MSSKACEMTADSDVRLLTITAISFAALCMLFGESRDNFERRDADHGLDLQEYT